jgi:tricorn protease
MNGLAITIPKDSLASSEGYWLIENEGVSPTIAVDPSPDEAVTGRDRLLETAVMAVLDQIARRPEAAPRAPPPLPAYPPGGDVPGATFGMGGSAAWTDPPSR